MTISLVLLATYVVPVVVVALVIYVVVRRGVRDGVLDAWKLQRELDDLAARRVESYGGVVRQPAPPGWPVGDPGAAPDPTTQRAAEAP